VVAVSPSSLYSLDHDIFVATVTGHAPTEDWADGTRRRSAGREQPPYAVLTRCSWACLPLPGGCNPRERPRHPGNRVSRPARPQPASDASFSWTCLREGLVWAVPSE
jgi:hypothetical protein